MDLRKWPAVRFRAIALALCVLSASTLSGPLAAGVSGGGPIVANVVSVEVSGEPGDYVFSVGIRSRDTGCEQYADWWEIVSPEGELIFRNTLAHSHVNEQPFVRAAGPVVIEADDEVWIRAHMFPTGYAGRVYRGSVEAGFRPVRPDNVIAPELEDEPPFPPDCAF